MNKAIKKVMGIFVLSAFLITQTGCFGSFPLTNSVYQFNKEAGSKFVQEVLFLAMIIVPVYSIAAIVDAVILNTIEFWSGSSPMSMKKGEVEKKIVSSGDKTYEIIAMQYKYSITQIEGPQKGLHYEFIFNPETAVWTYTDAEQSIDLVKILDKDHVKILQGENEEMVFNINETSVYDIKAQLMQENLASK